MAALSVLPWASPLYPTSLTGFPTRLALRNKLNKQALYLCPTDSMGIPFRRRTTFCLTLHQPIVVSKQHELRSQRIFVRGRLVPTALLVPSSSSTFHEKEVEYHYTVGVSVSAVLIKINGLTTTLLVTKQCNRRITVQGEPILDFS